MRHLSRPSPPQTSSGYGALLASTRATRRRMAATLALAVVALGLPLAAVRGTEEPAVGSWSATGAMVSPRARHSATVLANGDVFVVGGPSGQAEFYHAAEGTWSSIAPVGSAGLDRSEHTATLLPNGKVLVAGGETNPGNPTALRTAQLYDPASGTVANTGDLTVPRYGHTASLLANGKVLVVGGKSFGFVPSPSPVPPPELYDPASGTWSLTGPPLIATRVGHTATVLANGEVLVTGGTAGVYDLAPAQDAAEIYDPATDSWRAAAPMGTPRTAHSATLLPDGKVLVAGSRSATSIGGPVNSAEVFDPDGGANGLGTWTEVGSMAIARAGHAAALLGDGRVLVVGGSGDTFVDASAEIYDPAANNGSGAWQRAGSLNVARAAGTFTASVLDGSPCHVPGAPPPAFCGAVLVAGGWDEGGTTRFAEVFDLPAPRPQVLGIAPATGPIWGGTQVTITGTGFEQATEVRFGERVASFRVESATTIVVVSPAQPAGAVSVAVTSLAGTSPAVVGMGFSYVTSAGAWQAAGAIGETRSRATATLLADSTVLVAGGFDASGQVLASAEIFDPATATWRYAPDMGKARAYHSAVRLADGTVLVAGGEPISSASSAEVYEPTANAGAGGWRTVESLAAGRSRHTATLLGSGKVLVAGGFSSFGNGSMNTAEVYDPARGSWSSAGSLTTSRSDHAATLLGDGTVLVAGGTKTTKEAELYDPTAGTTGTWRSAGSMHYARSAPTATLLPNGRVLVAGGDGGGTAELFRPDDQTWVSVPGMASERSGGAPDVDFTATVVAGQVCQAGAPARPSACGKVLVVGGRAGPSSAALASVELYDPAMQSWAPALSLVGARFDHTATALPDGRVLVAGGAQDDFGQGVALAEVFDPASAGAQSVPTVASVTLGSGGAAVGPTAGGTEVRIRGVGFFGPGATVSFGGRPAQRVSFVADDEVVATTPASSRQGPVEVRVARPGAGPGTPGRFVYAPGTWRGTGALRVAHDRHTATALGDGRVLVAGGYGADAPSAEIYDPAKDHGAGAWSDTAAMNIPRSQHTATLLEPASCKAGTAPAHYPCGTVLVVGGQVEAVTNVPDNDLTGTARVSRLVTDSAELYAPGANDGGGAWVLTKPMGLPRFSHSATLLADGRVLVAGGVTAEPLRPEALSSAEIYDPVADTWTPAAPMHHGRNLHAATALPDGQVMVVGGLELDPDPARQVTGAILPPPVVGGRVNNGSSVPLTSVEVFDPGAAGGSGAWSEITALDVPRYGHSATTLGDGSVLVAGGKTAGGPTASSERYDPTTHTWEAGLMKAAHAAHSATLLGDGTVLVAGAGELFVGDPNTTPSVSTAEVFDPTTGRWSLTTSMAAARGGHSATVLDGSRCGGGEPPVWCGAVLVAGGGDSKPGALPAGIAASEVYTPAPHVEEVRPAAAAAGQPTEVVLQGSGFAGATKVVFGDAPAAGFRVDSPTRITATAPSLARGRVEAAVVGPGGPSARTTPQSQAVFTSYDAPAAVTALVATATSASTVELSWDVPDDGLGKPVGEYVLAQDGVALCGGHCRPATPGHLEITGLSPSTTYHYSLAAVNAAGLVGPAGEAEVTTPGLGAGCGVSVTAGPGQVALSGGRYHLIGVPGGTAVSSSSPLYGWFDQGAGGAYQVASGPERGHGYWSFGFCERVVDLAPGGPASVSMPLGAYHASMVGNPSATSAATVSGQDFAARWDPRANGGAGGYELSPYRKSSRLGLGEGSWVFSYVPTVVRIDAG